MAIVMLQGNNKPYMSFPFSESVYGTISMPVSYSRGFVYANDPVETAAITNGRWQKLEAEFNTEFESLKYGYGYMRAPWSMNPSPYISRFAKDSTR